MDILWQDPESTITKWNTPLFENEKIVELPVDQRTITRRCTQKSIDFIKSNKDKPFFLYIPHSMPHIPLYVPDEIRDPDPQNAYINTIEHIDSEVGRLLDTLDKLNLSSKTYVILLLIMDHGFHLNIMVDLQVLFVMEKEPLLKVDSVFHV